MTTDEHGVATGAVPLGRVMIGVTKEGFLPASVTVAVDQSRVVWGSGGGAGTQ